MTDKVQKIKDWISKEQDGLMDAQGNFEYPEHEGAYHILCNLDAYIDSIQDVSETDFGKKEEHKFKVGQSIRQGDVVAKIVEVSEEGYHCDNAFVPFTAQDNWELVEEPVSEGKDIFDNCLKSEEKFNLPQKISGNINCENCLYSSACALGDIQACIIDKPVIKELEEEIDNYVKRNGYDGLDSIEEVKYIANHFAKWQKERLWKPADGDDLPEIDREVIALLDNGKAVFAHRPPEYWDGKDIVTGKVTRNYPKTYDKGGWNIPDVKYWLDVELPKEIEL